MLKKHLIVIHTLLIMLLSLAVFSACTSFWNKARNVYEPAKDKYIKLTKKVDTQFAVLDTADSHYQNVREVFYNDETDTFTETFNHQSDTKQLELIDASGFFKKHSGNLKAIRQEYNDLKKTFKTGDKNLAKIEKISIKLENIIKEMPKYLYKLRR